MDTYIRKCEKLCGDCHKPASLQTSASGKNSHRLVITSPSIHQDYGTTNHGPFLLHWRLPNLVLNTKQNNYIDHLIGMIKCTYNLTEDWNGNLYCGVTLDWDYKNRMVDISMPGYINKKLQEYKQVTSNCVQNFILLASSQYDCFNGVKLNCGGTIKSDGVHIRKMQAIIGLAEHADTKICFHAPDIIMNIHLDASYLLEAKAQSRAGGHFLGWMPNDNETIHLNGAFHVRASKLKSVVALAVEAKLGHTISKIPVRYGTSPTKKSGKL
jgi:hypothetical protein